VSGCKNVATGQAPVGVHTYDPNYLTDYVKLLVFTQNSKAVLTCMEQLNSELSGTIARQKKTADDLDEPFQTMKKRAAP
jgi:hypothetical protein